jgi:catechol 2,3-dioxygenase-like lactoylglutathione lyase family enzyme
MGTSVCVGQLVKLRAGLSTGAPGGLTTRRRLPACPTLEELGVGQAMKPFRKIREEIFAAPSYNRSMWLLKLAALSLLILSAFAQMKASIVILSVTDLNRAIEFYRDRLGLKLSSTNEDFAFFDAGGITIALRGGRPKSDPADLASTEIAFGVEHVKAAYQSLSKAGVAFKREPRIVTGTTWATDFRDPDGHVLSIVGPE